MKTAALTDVGKIRKINEDSMKVFTSDEYSYAIVADGMGGHQAGEIASAMAVDVITDYVAEYMTPKLDRFQSMEVMRQAFLAANCAIYEYSCENESVMGMGTTTTMCMVRGGFVIYAHVGDSRAYMIGDGIVQITRDHSFVQELVKLGQITPEEAKHHPRRNYITRAMGVEAFVRIDTGVKPYNGEKLLLCSDGLFGEIEDGELFNAVKNNSAETAVNTLIELANERGGSDNITAIVMEGDNN
ncbi:MAG: Stp1/IreP family PP2C-type Ser/Thr phosphatase [Clostridiales bacterium]|nr:Stp1/IreP family PP2C-type Ser/Thr phosphatase [Clostridiales bacterium]